jgi:hypothetical protein
MGVVLIIAAGFAIRGYASVHSMGIVHPDEHQQYMEQANRLAYGYGETFWEQDRGMRSYLFPGALAGCLLALDFCGMTDPVVQSAAIRMILASVTFLVLIAVAWRYSCNGHALTATFFLAWVALSPFMVFVSVRTLSETAVLGPFFLALLLIPRRPSWAGVLLAVSFGIRFQVGILIGSAFALLLMECLGDGARWRKMVHLLAGFGVAVLALGWLDRVTLGSWFHSPLEYLRANIAENKSAAFGVQPWDYYLDSLGRLFGAFPLAGICLLAGATREWRLALAAVVFISVHSVIGHKESRFLWTLTPIAYLLTAIGLEMLSRRIPQGTIRLAAGALVIFSVAWVEGRSLANMPWNYTPYVDSAHALATVGRRPEVTGAGVYGTTRFVCGNYFYLRRPIPLVVAPNLDYMLRSLEERPDINYLVTDPKFIANFEKLRPEEVDRMGGVGIYFLRRSR